MPPQAKSRCLFHAIYCINHIFAEIHIFITVCLHISLCISTFFKQLNITFCCSGADFIVGEESSEEFVHCKLNPKNHR